MFVLIRAIEIIRPHNLMSGISQSIHFTQIGADQECQSSKTTLKIGAENRRNQVWSLLLGMVVAAGFAGAGSSRGILRPRGDCMKGEKSKRKNKR